MKHVVVASALLLSLNLFAGEESQEIYHQCPMHTETGLNIISNLNGIKESIRQKEGCSTLAEKVDKLVDVIGPDGIENVKSVINGLQGESLEGDQVDQLASFSQSVAGTLSELVSGLNNSSKSCFNKSEETTVLQTISTITQEISTLAGNVTGPYGMAVNFGGNILASVIKGIDEFIQKRRPYNFKKDEELNLFRSQFCSYTESLKDITDYLHLDTRLEELNGLHDYLVIKISDLRENCQECNAYAIAHEKKVALDKIISLIRSDARLVENDFILNNSQTFSRCTEIARSIHAPSSHLKDLFLEIENYENTMMGSDDRYILQSMVNSFKVLEENFPTLDQCWAMSQQEKFRTSKDFNDLVRDDILGLIESTFAQQLGGFKAAADKKYQKPNGTYTANSIDRLSWIGKEKGQVVADLNDPNYRVSTEEIRRLKYDLTKTIVDQHMDDFMKYNVKRSDKRIKRFRRSIKKFVKRKVKAFNKTKRSNTKAKSLNDIFDFLRADEGKKYYRESALLLSQTREVLNHLDIALDQSFNFGRTCHYLQYTSTINADLDETCADGIKKLDKRYADLKEFNNDIKAAKKFEEWADMHLDIQSSRVRDLTQKLENWRSLGDSRWALKP